VYGTAKFPSSATPQFRCQSRRLFALKDLYRYSIYHMRKEAYFTWGRQIYWKRCWFMSPMSESRSPRCRVQPWANCWHTCSSVTKQYNLVPAIGRRCSAAGEVTAGLAESNGSLLPGLWLRSPAGWLPRTGISSGTLYLYLWPPSILPDFCQELLLLLSTDYTTFGF